MSNAPTEFDDAVCDGVTIAIRKWRAQHRQCPDVIITMTRSDGSAATERDFQININPEYRLQYSDDDGKTWVAAKENYDAR